MHASVRCFLTGGAAYNLVELLWRRKTHPSMFLAGGTCLALLDKALQGPLKGKSLFVKCAAGSGIITGVELLTGLVVNRWMGKEVWDYSDQKLQFQGQICAFYSVMWFFLSIPACGLCRVLRKGKRHEKRFPMAR